MDFLKSAQLWDACAAAGVAGLWLTGKAPLSSSHALCFFVKQRLRNVSLPARSVRSFYNSSWLARVENQNLHLMLRPMMSCQFHQKAIKFRVARLQLTLRVSRGHTCRRTLVVADERFIALREVLIFIRRRVIVKRPAFLLCLFVEATNRLRVGFGERRHMHLM